MHVSTPEAARITVPVGSNVPSGTELLGIVLDLVHQHTNGNHVDANTPLMDAGLNSLSATLLVRQLEKEVGIALPPVLIFQ